MVLDHSLHTGRASVGAVVDRDIAQSRLQGRDLHEFLMARSHSHRTQQRCFAMPGWCPVRSRSATGPIGRTRW